MFSYRIDDDIVLRLLQEKHSEELFKLMDKNRNYLRKWIRFPDRVTRIEEMAPSIRDWLHQFANNEGFDAGIWYQDELAGAIRLQQVDMSHRTAEIAYWISESLQGKGIITRACRFVIDYAFKEYGLNRVEIAAAFENRSSRAIPERLGFTEEGTLRQLLWHHDHFVDLVIYSMLAEEWQVDGDASAQS